MCQTNILPGTSPAVLLPGIILAVLLFPMAGMTQVTQAWVERFANNPPFQNGPAAIVSDASGNVYITGTTAQRTTAANFLTIKYNSAGVGQWIATYNGPANGDDEAVAIALDAAGNVYVTGTSADGTGSSSNTAIATVKYSPTGTQLWVTRTGPGAITNAPAAITVDAAGNVYITGNTVNTSFAYDYLTFKLNTNGVQQWAETYNGTANSLDYATAIAVDTSGNVFVTGKSIGENIKKINTFYDYLTIKYNTSGGTVWTNRYNGAANTTDVPTAIALDRSANVYVTGASGKFALTVSYTSAGAQRWLALDTLTTNNTALKVDPSGNILTAGYLTTPPDFLYYHTNKYSSAGVRAWSATFVAGVPSSFPPFVGLAVDNTGTSYITGSYAPFTPTSFEYATIAYTPSGAQGWVATFTGTTNGVNVPTAICLSNGSAIRGTFAAIYVTGISDDNGSGGSLATLKYTQSMVVSPHLASQQDRVAIGTGSLISPAPGNFSNYPNPFKGMTTISYTLPYDSHVSIRIYDQTGRMIATLVDEKESAGNYNLPFYSGSLASGIYHYRLLAISSQGSFNQTRQMLLQK